MNKDEIKTFLPHRDAMLLVDEMHMEGECCVSTYTVRGDEFFLQGHFPSRPVVPGVILCEIMGQGSSLLIRDKLDGSTLPMYVGLDNVRFKHMVQPGDTVLVQSRLVSVRANVYFVESRASVDGQLCCSARLTVALVKKD